MGNFISVFGLMVSMYGDLLVEIRKMEVRLNDFVKAEKEAVELLRNCINSFTEFNNFVQKLEEESKLELLNKALELRFKAVKTFQEALEKMGKAEHEKSHLLSSYGSLILVLEEISQKLLERRE